MSSLGSGACLLDYDADGRLDLYLVTGGTLDGRRLVASEANALFRAAGAWTFADASQQARLDDRVWGMGCTVGDVDNDGFDDVFVANIGPDAMYRNLGDGTFERHELPSGPSVPDWSTSSAFFDADGDGDLDLYVAGYVGGDLTALPLPGSSSDCAWLGLPVFCGPRGLQPAADVFYRNDGAGSFVEATDLAGFGVEPGYGLGVVAGDYDDDGDVDIYVANDSVPNYLFANDGEGRFEEVALFTGAAYNGAGMPQAGMGVDMADIDGDGTLDLFVTNFSHDTNTPYLNLGGGLFSDQTAAAGLGSSSWFYLGWATRIGDFDNDSRNDLFVVNGHIYPGVDEAPVRTTYRQRNQIFWNGGAGRLAENEPDERDALAVAASSRGAAFGDIDDDGDLDAVVTNIDAGPSLLRNDGVAGRHWIAFALTGTRSNRNAIGARVTVFAGERALVGEVRPSGSFLSSNDRRVHFGLGALASVERAVIRWPDGATEEILEPVVDTLHRRRQPSTERREDSR